MIHIRCLDSGESRMFTQGATYAGRVVGPRGALIGFKDNHGHARFILRSSLTFVTVNKAPDGPTKWALFEELPTQEEITK